MGRDEEGENGKVEGEEVNGECRGLHFYNTPVLYAVILTPLSNPPPPPPISLLSHSLHPFHFPLCTVHFMYFALLGSTSTMPLFSVLSSSISS